MKSESEINAAFAERQMDVIFNPASSRAAKSSSGLMLFQNLADSTEGQAFTADAVLRNGLAHDSQS